MAREIKFRAWHQYDKRMVYGPSGDESNPSWVLAMCSANNIEPMQYTGINDRKESEIYDKDWIKHLDPHTLETHISEVYWSDKGYWAIRDKEGTFVDLLHRAELPEIIGNSYNNTRDL